jgi:hypothetical protein
LILNHILDDFWIPCPYLFPSPPLSNHPSLFLSCSLSLFLSFSIPLSPSLSFSLPLSPSLSLSLPLSLSPSISVSLTLSLSIYLSISISILTNAQTTQPTPLPIAKARDIGGLKRERIDFFEVNKKWLCSEFYAESTHVLRISKIASSSTRGFFTSFFFFSFCPFFSRYYTQCLNGL